MIYLDNAATSFPKPHGVAEEMSKCILEYCANPGRAGHHMAQKTDQMVMDTRTRLADFFSINSYKEVVFTKNATEAINLGLYGLLKKGDHVITTSMEHHAVMRPLRQLEKDRRIELSVVRCDSKGFLSADKINSYIKSNTRLIVTTLSSNVNGTVMPVEDIGQICHENKIIYFLDGSQGAGSIPINVNRLNISMLAVPGHKGLLGPQGTGMLYVNRNIQIKSLIQGGIGSHSEYIYQPANMPDALESGTLNTPGIVGLGKALSFINTVGLNNIKRYKENLFMTMHYELERIPSISLYSVGDADKNSGIIAFNIKDMESLKVTRILDREFNIATRAGMHCAYAAHSTLGTTRTGIVRVSPGCFNTIEDKDKLVEAVRYISSHYY